MTTPLRERIAELEDELKQRDRRIADLKADLAKAEDLIVRQDGHVRSCIDEIDNWIQAFEMVQDEDGAWQWNGSFVQGDEWFKKYKDLQREWNKFVPDYNAIVTASPRNVGRPLEASDAQRQTVLKLHKDGMSLRGIAEETSLGLRTVRTIVDQRGRKDRTTRKYLERIKPDTARERQWIAKSRTRAALPKRIHAARKQGDELRQEAKGLK